MAIARHEETILIMESIPAPRVYLTNAKFGRALCFSEIEGQGWERLLEKCAAP
jgi:hypothetical protein